MTILAFLLAILILVGFHEFGHYITAKFCGIIVERFSIGFGPVLWKKTPKNPFDTEFVLSAIPLGGYVKLLDSKERSDLSAEQSGKAFDQQVLWKRSLVVAAGPFANFLLAWVLLSALFLSNPMQVKPILDEPNSNLDSEGETALNNAILRAKENKITTIIITHRTSVISICDKVMILRDGEIKSFDSVDKILGKSPQTSLNIEA